MTKRLLLTMLCIVGALGVSAQKDVTSTYITNATLANGTTGWTVSNFNTPVQGNNTVGYASEAYAGWGSLEKTSYSLTQTITLPAGNYTLVNYAFFRQGESYNTNSEKSLAYLKAGENQVALKTLGSITAAGYANSQAEGANAFDSKMYRNTLDFTIDSDNTEIEIGLVGTFDELRSWCIAGMFELIDNDSEASMDSPFDVTGYLTNPGFEYRDMTGWTLSEDAAFGAQGNASFNNKAGGYYAEKWQASGGLSDRSMSQSLSNLPNGYYQLSAYVYYGGEGAYIKLNDKTTSVTANASGKYTVGCVTSDGTLNVEAGLSGGTSSWVCFDRFTLAYMGDVTAAYTAVVAKAKKLYDEQMNADVLAEMKNAVVDISTLSDVDDFLNAIATLNSKIDAAEASIEAYKIIAPAIENAEKFLSDNSATDDALATFNEIYTGLKAAYTDGTVADADVLSQVKAIYEALVPVVKSQTGTSADMTFAIVNQSFEYGDMTGWTATSSSDTGVRSTSNATYATEGSDGYYLFNTWWQGVPLTQTIGDLPNGQYTLTASVASDGATIYLLGNGNHNDGTETGGEYPSSNVFQEATFTFLVKDGNATIGVVGGAGGDAGVHKEYTEEGYWWYKADNFRLVKNRDLTEEELAVFPTAILLTDVSLDEKSNSTTIEVAYEPEDASEGYLVWTSSDVSVATVDDKGVVTGVAPGTATITATSTLDTSVSGSCTVTVTYPESTVPETYYVNDGAKRTVYTLSQDNLIKNGTFGYPNAVAGWKTVGYTTDAVAGNFTVSETGGAVDDGAYIKTSGGGVASEKTLRKSVPVEAGKTYYFAVYTSGKAPSSGNMAYNALFKMKDAVTEDGSLKSFEWPQGAEKTATEWSKTEYVFTADENHPYVGVRMGWNDGACFDEFVLVEVTKTEEVGNVDYATAVIPTANIGTEPFQYSQDAVDAANALVQGTATVKEVEDAYAALTTINEPAEGQLFNVILTYAGWTYDNKAMTYIVNGRTDGGLYNVQYKEEANENLAQAFTFTKMEGSNYVMSQIDAEGVARYLSTGVPYGGNTSQIRTVTNADDAMVVTVIPTTTEGVWNLRNVAANNYVGSQDAGVFTVNSHINFIIRETHKPSIAINTTAAGYGTVMLPFAYSEIPAAVKVHKATSLDGQLVVLEQVEEMEANKPYIIEGSWNETLTGDAQGVDLTYTEGLLTGVYAQTDAPVGSYVLQSHDGAVGFYRVDEGKQPKVGANRAYLTAPAGTEVKALNFGGDATGIQGINGGTDSLEGATIYDLSGRAVKNPTKGLYIVNGKKVYVK